MPNKCALFPHTKRFSSTVRRVFRSGATRYKYEGTANKNWTFWGPCSPILEAKILPLILSSYGLWRRVVCCGSNEVSLTFAVDCMYYVLLDETQMCPICRQVHQPAPIPRFEGSSDRLSKLSHDSPASRPAFTLRIRHSGQALPPRLPRLAGRCTQKTHTKDTKDTKRRSPYRAHTPPTLHYAAAVRPSPLSPSQRKKVTQKR